MNTLPIKLHPSPSMGIIQTLYFVEYYVALTIMTEPTLIGMLRGFARGISEAFCCAKQLVSVQHADHLE